MENKKENLTKKVKSVAFQLADPMEYKLYWHCMNQGVYFSTYIKRLIQRDIERGEVNPLSIEDLKRWKNNGINEK
ncbi:hypothetical protein [Bacillus cereus]|uniref:Uncharacterized protein n=1 Tax=Bacillus cereus VD184 TaxID=1053242 RepID=A0A9W5VPH6_BACCE|nr:hypothetical protein [Bacillus cereus]EOQ01001.1 hypothetical protein IKC_06199 [Bacillus cereus VD184]